HPARVWYDPPGIVTPEVSVETRAPGTGDRVAWSLDPSVDPQLPRSKVGGGVAAGMGRQRYTRRLEDPRRAPGLVLAHFLSVLGVKVDGAVSVRAATGGARLPSRLTYVSSPPLSELLLPLGKDSDNFTAEMLLVALSSSSLPKTEGGWSSERGASALRAWLESGGIPLSGVSLTNGSGL